MKLKLREISGKIKSMWSTPPEGRHLTLKEILSFGGSTLGVSFIINIIVLLITASQISEVYQIDVMHGPIICFTASIISLRIQPMFGKLLQNTNTKIGRYKPYIIFIAPVISVFAILATWQPQNLTENSRIIFAYLVCIPTLVLWSIWFIQTFACALVGLFTNLAIVLMALVKRSMGYEPRNYFNVLDVDDNLMKIATDYFNVALYISAASAALMFVVMIFYNLNKDKHREIILELERISKAEGYDV